MKKSVILLVLIIFISSVSFAELQPGRLWINNVEIPYTLEKVKKEPKAISYVYANGQRIAKVENNEVYYFHNDHLGSPVAITNSKGEVVWQGDYKPFGESFNEVSFDGNNIKYNSKELDKDTELHYYGSRYYNAPAGRFITADTVRGKLVNPQSLNLYVYTLNNPMKYIDPTGEKVEILGSKSSREKILDIFNEMVGGGAVNVHEENGKFLLSLTENYQGDRPKTFALLKDVVEHDETVEVILGVEEERVAYQIEVIKIREAKDPSFKFPEPSSSSYKTGTESGFYASVERARGWVKDYEPYYIDMGRNIVVINPEGFKGRMGKNRQIISFTLKAILAHELLGHARSYIMSASGEDYGERPAVNAENIYRKEAGLLKREVYNEYYEDPKNYRSDQYDFPSYYKP